MNIAAHIVVADAAEASAWYANAFGARELNRIPLPGDKLMSVELAFGDSVVHVGSEFPDVGILSPLTIGGTATVLQLYCAEVDEVWERAVEAGAEIRTPLGDTFWGDRHGQLTDPFGHRWNLARHDRDVPADEIERSAAEAFGITEGS